MKHSSAQGAVVVSGTRIIYYDQALLLYWAYAFSYIAVYFFIHFFGNVHFDVHFACVFFKKVVY